MHLDCYHNVRESTGPWYCELCQHLKCSGAPEVDFWEKFSSAAECALCGGTTGAFRKSTSGQWVHAFCAEVFSVSLVFQLLFIIKLNDPLDKIFMLFVSSLFLCSSGSLKEHLEGDK